MAMAELYSLIKKINEELGMAIIMVSHDIHAAVEYADHILHLGHDQTFWGSTDEYKKSEMYLRFTGGDSNA